MPAENWPWLERWFQSYLVRYLRRSFHAIHLLGTETSSQWQEDGKTPLLVCMNHSSWWDLLLGMYVEQTLFGWERYAVLDAQQLERYKIFNKLGGIGVDRDSLAGARAFIAYAENLLGGQRRALWITPQGEFVSNHARPVRFQPGLGTLAARLDTFYFARATLHYEFWNERLPEAFVSISTPERFEFAAQNIHRRTWVHGQERCLEAQMDELLEAVQSRDAARFTPLLRGQVGVSPTYDLFRGLLARLRGQTFTPEHSSLITPQWKQRDATKQPAGRDNADSTPGSSEA